MSLQALKLTKENLPTIASTTGVNPESISHMAAFRDRYVLFETQTLGFGPNWRIWTETQFHRKLQFTEPETNRFIDVVTH